MSTPQEQAEKLALNIATVIMTKLEIKDRYNVVIRRHGSPCPMPWIEMAFCQMNKDPETHEFSISLPENRYTVETKEERSILANYLYKSVALMIGKRSPKD